MASHRRSPQPGLAARTTRVTVLSAAAAATAALSGGTAQIAAADPAGAGGAGHTSQADRLGHRLDRLYQRAEQATEAYDAAQEHAGRVRDDLSTLQDRAAHGQQRVNGLRDELGTLAAAQYRDGGIDPALTLLLSDDRDTYLDRAATLDRVSAGQTDRLHRLQAAERDLLRQRAQAADKLTELQRAGTVLQKRKQAVQSALAEARRMLRALPPAQRADHPPGPHDRASRGHATPAAALPDLPDLPASSGRAALAVAAARQVIGAPYVWGAAGPNSFDCSGLMQYAYRHAGVSLPRTSQEQLDSGPHVPLGQARPGDLIIYRGDASHVGMYAGGGRVIHAPYPGARVRYDPVGMMPVMAVTRP